MFEVVEASINYSPMVIADDIKTEQEAEELCKKFEAENEKAGVKQVMWYFYQNM